MRLDLVAFRVVLGVSLTACVVQQPKRTAAEPEREHQVEAARSTSMRRPQPIQPVSDTGMHGAAGSTWVGDTKNRAASDRSSASQVQEDKRSTERRELSESCARDRAERYAQRQRDEETKKKTEQARERERTERAAFIQKNCKRSEKTVAVVGDGVEWDSEGYLRRTRGAATVVSYDCPANGPPGARGHITVDVIPFASPGDPARIARLSDRVLERPVFLRERDNRCYEADQDAEANKPGY